MKVLLERHESSDEGTFGVLIADGFLFYTGELPWRENERNISCIPTGQYKCVWEYSDRFKRFMYEIKGVTGRFEIKFHSANFMGDVDAGFKSELNGCIALGEKFGIMDGQKVLLLSRPAVRRFEIIMNKLPFDLEIKDV